MNDTKHTIQFCNPNNGEPGVGATGRDDYRRARRMANIPLDSHKFGCSDLLVLEVVSTSNPPDPTSPFSPCCGGRDSQMHYLKQSSGRCTFETEPAKQATQ
eukprot:1144952-Pelagomonas_calceolata.AAC.1